jgi:hypothetical protein
MEVVKAVDLLAEFILVLLGENQDWVEKLDI